MALALTAEAQRLDLRPELPQSRYLPESHVSQHGSGDLDGNAREGGDSLFYEDFANGLDGNNGWGAWTVEGADGALWLHDTDGPNGDFSNAAQERIQSATVTNGFMIFDTNLSNNGCGSASQPCENRTGYLVSPLLNLSGTPNVQLVYTQALRWCCSGGSGHFIDISTDNGLTWPTRLAAIVEYQQVTNSNPGTIVRRFNISEAIAADPNNVVIRFSHETGELQSLSHYFWQIDDVMIVEAFDNDLGMLDPHQDEFIPENSFTNALDYTIYPVSQVRTISVGSPVRNEGSTEATNVALNVAIDQNGTEVLNESATVAALAPAQIDSTLRVDFTIPAVTGNYTIDYTLTMDAEDERQADNTATTEFSVSDHVYAYDKGERDGDFSRLADASGQYPGFEAGNLFWIENNAMAHGIQVALARGSTQAPLTGLNAAFEVVLYNFSLEEPEIVAESDLVTVTSMSQLTQNGQANFFTVPFFEPVELEAGTEYAACVRFLGGTPRVVVATSGFSRPFSSLVNSPELSGQTWSILSRRPMVRLSFNPTIGIADRDRTDIGLSARSMPNPTNGVTRLVYEIDEKAPVSIELVDVSGKIVRTFDEGTKAPGRHQLNFDVTDLQEGVYFHVVRAGESQVTGRMVVVK